MGEERVNCAKDDDGVMMMVRAGRGTESTTRRNYVTKMVCRH